MPDLLLKNARIWTGDDASPWANAAVIQDGRFSFAGRDTDINPPTAADVLDAEGRLVVPGLTDGHAHLLQTGLAMRAVDLKGVTSVGEAAERVGERAAKTAAGDWVQGAGWDQNLWPDLAFPDKRALDAVAPDTPVALTHTSAHCVWVNSAALREAGVTASTEVPDGGRIDIGADGEPSGILRDTAAALIYRAMPAPTREQRIDALAEAIRHANGLGLTGVHAMDVNGGELAALKELNEQGALKLRVRAYLSQARLERWIEEGIKTGGGDDALRIGGVKFFADGALGSLTAWMLRPYEHGSDTGLPLQPVHQLEERVRRCLQNGLAPAIHAIGDRANREVLDIIERAQALAPSLPRRIEHAQLLEPEDSMRFVELGVSASMQPIHATQDYLKVDREWGARGSNAYVFASLLWTGANVAFGSDSPVETMSPIAGIHAAVTRRTPDGKPSGGWFSEEATSLEAAVAAYTAGCATACGESERFGKIAKGFMGDFVVLSDDLFAMDDPMCILDATAVATVVGGEIVYQA
ncbi:MAG: amidohydrolase [Chloroflexi bacterium]|nr:amidohydrolase [Chloroflexota bacterium]